MSDSPTLRIASTLAVALTLSSGCDVGPEPGSTLPRAERPANPSGAEGVRRDDVGAFVEAQARALAAEPWQGPPHDLPAALAALDYDAYRSIRFRSDAALWADDGRFQIQLFHPGFLFDRPVSIRVVEDVVRTVRFDPDLFTYEGAAEGVRDPLLDAGDAPGTLGYAGFRVHFPLHGPERLDEVAVFQGASYFRLVGRGQVYGLSARGLAVDVASDRPEEFPDFTAFWLVRPATDTDPLVVHALLDGPSVTGAYRLTLAPGESTVVDVDARLFARRDVGKLGVAPLSSMFLFDSGTAAGFDDFRGAVHDSDGLMTRTRRGEWIWRPLSNGPGLRVSSLRDVDPVGFGLVQRARDFSEYLDAEALYHRRPSVWVETHPDDRWGAGGVELLEIPTETEFNDNVAAYWVPDEPFRAGETRRYRYRLRTFDDRLEAQNLGRVVRTRSGAVSLPGSSAETRRAARRFVVDFEGGALDALDGGADVTVSLETLSGRVDDVRAERLPGRSGWRASFVVEADGDRPPDLRLFLTSGEGPVTETWTYVWNPAGGR